MKIGILTFHSSHNCGSMLQAFALQYILQNRFNQDCEIINYSNRMSKNMYGPIDLRLNKAGLKNNINRVRFHSAFKNSYKDYQAFFKQYLVLSKEKISTINGLSKIAQKYDMIISGGDQIWNVRCGDAGKEYYLNFTHSVKKVAYSPSLGGSNILKYADNLQEYKSLLNEFSYISVREPNGKKWLETLTERDVEIIADPTLLLSPQEWCTALPIPDIQEEYIFNYAFYHNRIDTNIILQKISQETGLPIYTIDFKSFAMYRLDKFGFRRYQSTGPLSFLSLMKNASLVLTQSFHGTLFSALFNRPFWSYNWEGMHNPEDDRATAILKQLGLEERYQMIEDLEKNKNIFQPINYKLVNQKIEVLRNQALAYIKKCLI